MIQKTYTARMNRVRTMLKGLTAHPDQLEKHGATPEFRKALAIFQENLQQIQGQRRNIKRLSLEATTAKNLNLKNAERLCSKARKWVRREFPPETWAEFGFTKGEYNKDKGKGENEKGKKDF